MPTEQFARFVVDTPVSAIPAEVMARARNAVIDTFGVALAGRDEPVSAIAARWAREMGAAPQAGLWGHGLRTAVPEAAFANGIAAHALDFDDSMVTLHGHPSAAVVAAALAVGEFVHASGEQLLAAYAFANEIAGKFGRAFGDEHYLRGWHSTSTIGVYACAAACARLWGLDAMQLCHAWGLAAAQMGGLVRNFGSMAKPFHVGQAARAGVLAAWMAKAGMTADPRILEGPNSVLDTYGGADRIAPEALAGRLGKPWDLLDPGVNVKRWPCCYGTHRGLTGIFALRESQGLRAEDIESMTFGYIPGNDAALIDREPASGLEGKFSMEYTAAAALMDGEIGFDTFTDAMMARPEVRRLMRKASRYRLRPGDFEAGAPVFVDVTITTRQGRHELRVHHAPGSRGNPMDAAQHEAKFMDCARRGLDDEGARRLLGLLRDLDRVPDVSQVVAAAAAKE
ncbi:MmgE/PrpD family protein [Achromobacter aloeverae]